MIEIALERLDHKLVRGEERREESPSRYFDVKGKRLERPRKDP